MSEEQDRRDPEASSPEPGEENSGAEPAGEEPVPGTGEETVPGEPEAVEAPEDLEEVAPGDEPEIMEDELVAVTEELEAVRRERDEYLESMKRMKAEFENARKRQERERIRILSMASERLVQELLPVLDNLDRALEAGGDIREGVQATRDQLADVLGDEGLLPVASDGQIFDPNVHEAVMGQFSEEHEEGTIIQTFQRGYVLNGKPIRAAKVVVAKQV